jgi:hypothetical protein
MKKVTGQMMLWFCWFWECLLSNPQEWDDDL